jgi:hypothetical protein
MRPYTFSRCFFSEKKTKQSNSTVWSKFSTLAPSLLFDSPQFAAECLEKVTFVSGPGAAQQLRWRSFSKNFSGGKKL